MLFFEVWLRSLSKAVTKYRPNKFVFCFQFYVVIKCVLGSSVLIETFDRVFLAGAWSSRDALFVAWWLSVEPWHLITGLVVERDLFDICSGSKVCAWSCFCLERSFCCRLWFAFWLISMLCPGHRTIFFFDKASFIETRWWFAFVAESLGCLPWCARCAMTWSLCGCVEPWSSWMYSSLLVGSTR